MPLALTLVLASITDKLAEWTTSVVDSIGLVGIFLLMAPESAGIPIPSEPTMLFAGFAAQAGSYPLWAPVLVASVANLVGSWVGYAAGWYGRVELLEKNRLFHLKPSYMAWADRWFDRYGDATVFFSRMLPIIRTFISLPAGAARMPLLRFSVLTFLGAVPWNLMLVFIGYQAAERWDSWRSKLHYIDYTVIALIVIGAAYLAVRWYRRRGGDDGAPADAPA